MRVLRVDAPELGEHLTELELEAVLVQPERELRGGGERLLHLEGRLSLGIDEVDQVRLAGEVRVDRAEEGELRLLEGEAALVRVVGAALERLELVVVRGRPAAGDEQVEGRLEEPQGGLTRKRTLEERSRDRARPGLAERPCDRREALRGRRRATGRVNQFVHVRFRGRVRAPET